MCVREESNELVHKNEVCTIVCFPIGCKDKKESEMSKSF